MAVGRSRGWFTQSSHDATPVRVGTGTCLCVCRTSLLIADGGGEGTKAGRQDQPRGEKRRAAAAAGEEEEEECGAILPAAVTTAGTIYSRPINKAPADSDTQAERGIIFI